MTENLGLVPLINFSAVTQGVFRSAQPEYIYQYRWLKERLKLEYIVSLRAEKNTRDEIFAGQFGIQAIKYPIIDHTAPDEDQAVSFIEFVAKTDEPILIHCEHGQGRTSTFSILAKVAKGWSFADALADEKERFHYNFKHPAQENWLKNFFKRYCPYYWEFSKIVPRQKFLKKLIDELEVTK